MDTFLRPGAKIEGSRMIKVASMQKPTIVGFYSTDKVSETDFEIRLDASHCKYLKSQCLSQECHIDLNEFKDLHEDYVKKYDKRARNQQPIQSFWKYLESLVLKDDFVKCNENKLFDADVICHNRILAKIMMVNEKFSLLCTKYKGNIYIIAQKCNGKKKDLLTKTVAIHALFGGNFYLICQSFNASNEIQSLENYRITDHPNNDALNTFDPFNQKFHFVFTWKLGDISVMHFTGIQGVQNDHDITAESDLTKIKVATIKINFDHTHQKRRAVYQTPRWWCRALLECSDVHILNITDDEVIKSIDTHDPQSILFENEV